jgi:hypothetical protein
MKPILQWKSSITYSKCVSVALVIQQAKCMHLIILSSVACLPGPDFFSHYLVNAMIFGKNAIEHKMCVLI